MFSFSKCPTWWTTEDELSKKFQGGNKTGENIAALKCIMALSTVINFHSRKCQKSLSDLEEMTGLSRPMVAKGIKRLEELMIIEVNRSGHSNIYELKNTDKNDKWAKLPVKRVQKALPEIINRGAIVLAALKIYMLLVSIRPNDSQSVPVGYDKITDRTGIQRRHIRPAIDILINHELIKVTRREKEKEKGDGKFNTYTIIGISPTNTDPS